MMSDERTRAESMPTIRSDIVDVYIFRAAADGAQVGAAVGAEVGAAGGGERAAGGGGGVEFLQLLRADEPMRGTWQPIMGHVEAGETAVDTAWRELTEEVGLSREGVTMGEGVGGLVRGLWALEQVHPYYLASMNCIVLSPRFACEVDASWEPTLNVEHDAWRFVGAHEIEERFMWPGQREACLEITRSLRGAASLCEPWLRVWTRDDRR